MRIANLIQAACMQDLHAQLFIAVMMLRECDGDTQLQIRLYLLAWTISELAGVHRSGKVLQEGTARTPGTRH